MTEWCARGWVDGLLLCYAKSPTTQLMDGQVECTFARPIVYYMTLHKESLHSLALATGTNVGGRRRSITTKPVPAFHSTLLVFVPLFLQGMEGWMDECKGGCEALKHNGRAMRKWKWISLSGFSRGFLFKSKGPTV